MNEFNKYVSSYRSLSIIEGQQERIRTMDRTINDLLEYIRGLP